MYLPLHDVSRKKYFFKVSIKYICVFTSCTVLFAFFGCVFITMYKDFELANHTHCDVPNVFPSISASVGSYEPQKTIWKTAIYLQAPFRFFLVYLRSQYYLNVVTPSCYIVVTLAVMLNFIENLALVGLTYWPSTLYYSHHEFCFKTFIATSILYMLITYLMLTRCRKRPNLTNSEKKSLKIKLRAFITNVASFIFVAYFFLRHNRLCEPYVYSMFALSEYVLVVSNIAFHLTTLYDRQFEYIYITSRGLAIER